MIWQRYLLRELLKVFFLFLFCFYFVYALFDYSTHMQEFFKDKSIQLTHLSLYYLNQFIKRADLLLPLALLVATIKVLTGLTAHHELLALQCGGLRLRKLLRPFFLVALLCVGFNYLNFAFLSPYSLNFLDRFHDDHFHHSYRHGTVREPFHIIHLKDDSKLIYLTHEAEKDRFFDVAWIRSVDDIWKMKYLRADPKQPEAQFVDHLVRDDLGRMVKSESFPSLTLKELKWHKEMQRSGIIPFENFTIHRLWKLYSNKSSAYNGNEILCHLLFKLATPLLSLFVVLFAAPYCVGFRRNIPVLLFYTLFIFAFLGFYLMLDAAVILGKNRTVAPTFAIGVPFALCALWIVRKYRRIA